MSRAVKRDFEQLVGEVKRLHERLMEMAPVSKGRLGHCGFPGVYLFSEGASHLYVGRARHLRRRLLQHSRPSVKDAPFAFRLARIATGYLQASYKANAKSRKELLKNPKFVAAFAAQKERVAKMSIRYVEVEEGTTQAFLEIYTSTVLGTPHNEFKTT